VRCRVPLPSARLHLSASSSVNWGLEELADDVELIVMRNGDATVTRLWRAHRQLVARTMDTRRLQRGCAPIRRESCPYSAVGWEVIRMPERPESEPYRRARARTLLVETLSTKGRVYTF